LALTVELLGKERMPRYHRLRSLRASPPRETGQVTETVPNVGACAPEPSGPSGAGLAWPDSAPARAPPRASGGAIHASARRPRRNKSARSRASRSSRSSFLTRRLPQSLPDGCARCTRNPARRFPDRLHARDQGPGVGRRTQISNRQLWLNQAGGSRCSIAVADRVSERAARRRTRVSATSRAWAASLQRVSDGLAKPS
jgi:hypothetical protein